MNITPQEQAEIEAALGQAVPPVTPSPQLKANIMARVATTPQVPAEVATGAAELTAASRWFTRPVTMLVAAAVAIVLFAGGAFLGARFAASPDVETLAYAQAQSLAVLTASADLQRESADVAGGGTATLIWSLDQGQSALFVSELPRLPDGKTYQLWYIDAAGARSAGTFDASTTATTWRVLDGAMSGGETVGVTVEPDGGSPAPTTDPIVAIASS